LKDLLDLDYYSRTDRIRRSVAKDNKIMVLVHVTKTIIFSDDSVLFSI